MCWPGIKEKVWREFFLSFSLIVLHFPLVPSLFLSLCAALLSNSSLLLPLCLAFLLFAIFFQIICLFFFSTHTHTHTVTQCILSVTHRLFSEPEFPTVGLILLCYCLHEHRLLPPLSLLSLTLDDVLSSGSPPVHDVCFISCLGSSGFHVSVPLGSAMKLLERYRMRIG